LAGPSGAIERNRRWCSDGFEIGCDNGEWVRDPRFEFEKNVRALCPQDETQALAAGLANWRSVVFERNYEAFHEVISE